MAEAAEATVKEGSVEEENPSMEEILESIRGVISGDDEGGEGDNNNDQEKEESPQDNNDNEDILELTDMADDKEQEAQESDNTEQEGSVLDQIDEALESSDDKTEDAKDNDSDAPAAEEEDPWAEALSEQQAGGQDEEEDSAQSAPPEEEDPAQAPEESVKDILGSLSPEEEATQTAEPAGNLLTEDAAKKSAESLQSLIKKIPSVDLDTPAMRSGTTLEDLVVESLKPLMSEWLSENLPTIVEKIVEREVKRLMPQDL